MSIRYRKVVWSSAGLLLFIASCANAVDAESALQSATELVYKAEMSSEYATVEELLNNALPLVDRAISAGTLPDNRLAQAFAVRATIYRLFGRFLLAKRDLDSAIELAPDDLGNFFHRATVSWLLGHRQAAIQELTYVIDVDRDFPLAHKSRGGWYFQLGRFEKAVEDLTIAIDSEPDAMENLELRGDAYAMLGRYDEAIRDYRNAIVAWRATEKMLVRARGHAPDMDPWIDLEEEALLLKIADAHKASGREGESRDIYERILQKRPESQRAREALEELQPN